MIKLITMCLILNIITIMILLVWVTIMGIWHFKKDKKHEQEKTELKQSRDYHIKQLVKRSGQDDVQM